MSRGHGVLLLFVHFTAADADADTSAQLTLAAPALQVSLRQTAAGFGPDLAIAWTVFQDWRQHSVLFTVKHGPQCLHHRAVSFIQAGDYDLCS